MLLLGNGSKGKKQKEILKTKILHPPSNVEHHLGCDYVTPEKYRKGIRQHTHDSSKFLPKSPGLKAAVVSRLVKKNLESPRTRDSTLQIINRYASDRSRPFPSFRKKKKILLSTVEKMHKLRCKKDKNWIGRM